MVHQGLRDINHMRLVTSAMFGRRRLLPFAICMALLAAPAAAAPSSATVNATVKASVVKPLTLTALQDLDLGTIVLGGGTWSGAIVSISRAGVFSCANANTTCSGTRRVATYRVTGTNKQTIQITAPNATLINQADSTKTLTMVIDRPASVVLPNSGNPGIDFSVGGSISLSSATAGGLYAGTMNVTVDYQ